MQQMLINHPRLQVWKVTGSEGPQHDSYSFEEIHVKSPKGETILHQGLGTWLKHNGHEVKAPPELAWNEAEGWCATNGFVKLTGFTVNALRRIYTRKSEQCRKCGSQEFSNVRGYPGEYLTLCTKCGNITDSYFNESEVI